MIFSHCLYIWSLMLLMQFLILLLHYFAISSLSVECDKQPLALAAALGRLAPRWSWPKRSQPALKQQTEHQEPYHCDRLCHAWSGANENENKEAPMKHQSHERKIQLKHQQGITLCDLTPFCKVLQQHCYIAREQSVTLLAVSVMSLLAVVVLARHAS